MTDFEQATKPSHQLIERLRRSDESVTDSDLVEAVEWLSCSLVTNAEMAAYHIFCAAFPICFYRRHLQSRLLPMAMLGLLGYCYDRFEAQIDWIAACLDKEEPFSGLESQETEWVKSLIAGKCSLRQCFEIAVKQWLALPKEMVDIPGLLCCLDFMSESYEAELIETIDRQPWLTDLKRRVQHYGYKYDYKARSVDPSMYLGPLPDWSLAVVRELYDRGMVPQIPDQLIVNEYEPGQGISAHVDCKPCFDNTIVSVSLGSSCMMNFTSVKDKTKYSLFLERRSAIVLSGEARYDWQHAIPARKSDVYEGERIARRRRLSLTFRKVLVDRNAI